MVVFTKKPEKLLKSQKTELANI